MSVSRRDVLRSLSMGAAAASVLRVIPLQAAEYAHHTIGAEKAASKTGAYSPKFFPPAQYKTLQALCESGMSSRAGGLEASRPFLLILADDGEKIGIGGKSEPSCAGAFNGRGPS
jgi:gluconate 2-dehydrogenase gamma chain